MSNFDAKTAELGKKRQKDNWFHFLSSNRPNLIKKCPPRGETAKGLVVPFSRMYGGGVGVVGLVGSILLRGKRLGVLDIKGFHWVAAPRLLAGVPSGIYRKASDMVDCNDGVPKW